MDIGSKRVIELLSGCTVTESFYIYIYIYIYFIINFLFNIVFAKNSWNHPKI